MAELPKAEEEQSFTLEDTGILLPVGHQGRCNCCYAFVGTSCVSSLLAREREWIGHPLVRLSVQELVDGLHVPYPPKSFEVDQRNCYLNTNNNTFRYMTTRGISLEEDYPYEGRRGEPKNTYNNRKVRISGFHKVDNLGWNEDDINSQIKIQPLAGVIDVYESFLEFQGADMYLGSEANEERKGPHGIQVIGYGVENGVKYFKILNSWGENWGNNGIAKVRRDLITRLSFPYGPMLDEATASSIGRRSAKVKNQKEHDNSNKIGREKYGGSSKKNAQPSSSRLEQKGQSKTQKVGRKKSRSLVDIETNESLENNGGCWQVKGANITACKDTFRGRVCRCPIVQGVQFVGDGYTHCEASGALRCQVSDGGCWKETRNGWTFSACVDDHSKGCKCPGFSGDEVKSCEECYFKLKAWNAQNDGAATILIADHRVEPLITMDNPEEEDAQPHYLQNVSIPSAIISKALGDDVKNSLSEGKMVDINLDWREALPHPDELVEYEFWTNSNDMSVPKFERQIEFVKNLKGVAQILDQKGYTQFKRHYINWYYQEAFILSKQCKSQCTNRGRYCAPDPEQDFIWGYDAKDVIVQNLCQACFFKLAIESGNPWLWWVYLRDFAISSPMKEKYTKECADQVIQSLEFTGKDVKQIDRCVGDPEAGVDNPVLKAEQEAQIGKGSRGDVTILPTLAMNNRQYRGKLDKSAVLKAICSGFQETTEPAVCLSADVETNDCLENNGGCWQDKTANLTACKDTFRGRASKCPIMQEVKFVGDGYTLCEASGALRCEERGGGCWKETRNGWKFSAWDDHTKGCKCPPGFRWDGVKSYEGKDGKTESSWGFVKVIIFGLAAAGLGGYAVYK